MVLPCGCKRTLCKDVASVSYLEDVKKVAQRRGGVMKSRNVKTSLIAAVLLTSASWLPLAANGQTPAQCFANPASCRPAQKTSTPTRTTKRDPVELGFRSFDAAGRVQIQRSLSDLGHYSSAIDGLYGAGTRKAILLHLQSKGIFAHSLRTIEEELSALVVFRKDVEEFSASKIKQKDLEEQDYALNLIKDLEDYIALGSSTFDINFALAFAKVRDVKQGRWDEATVQKFKVFEKYLSSESGFIEFHNKRAEERQKAYAEKLQSAKDTLRTQISILKVWATANLLDARAASIVRDITKAESHLEKNDLKDLEKILLKLSDLTAGLGIRAKITAPTAEETEAVSSLNSDLEKSREEALLFISDIEAFVGSGKSDFDINFPVEFQKVRPIKNGAWSTDLLQDFREFKEYALLSGQFNAFHQTQERNRDAQYQEKLSENMRLLADNTGILRAWIKSNLLDERAAEIIKLISEAETAYDSSNLTDVNVSLNNTHEKLVELDLNSRASLAPSRKSAFIPDTIYIFGNYSGRAVSLFKGLDGSPKISGSTPSVCLQGDIDKWQRYATFDYLFNEFDFGNLTYLNSRCADESDFWAITGSELINVSLPPDFKNSYEKIEEFPRELVKGIEQRFDLISDIYEADILKGLKAGYGVVKIGETAISTCFVVSDSRKNHSVALTDFVNTTALYGLDIDNSIEATSIVDAFRLVQRSQCGFVYGDHTALAQIVEAAKNNKISYKVLPLWISAEQLSTIAARKDELKRAKLSEAESRKQQQELAVKAMEAAKEKSAIRQAELQSQYEVRFASIIDKLSSDISDAVGFAFENSPLDLKYQQNYVNAGLGNPERNELSAYEAIISDVQSLTLKKWEKTGFIVEKIDYGSAGYNGRSIEGVIGQVKISLKNREIGDFQTYCREVRALFDNDFDMWRLIDVDVCGSSSERWRMASAFDSRWLVSVGDYSKKDGEE